MKETLKIGVFLVGAVLWALAMPEGIRAQDSPEIAPINPVPELRDPVIKGVVVEGPRTEFHGQGYLERIENGKMVIADLPLEVSPLAVYYKRATGFPTLRSEFVPGVWVGYFLDENRVITSLWLFSAPPQ